MNKKRDCLEFSRSLGNARVTVVAERIERLELYALSARVNGKLFNTRQSDNPWTDAELMIQEAFGEIVGCMPPASELLDCIRRP